VTYSGKHVLGVLKSIRDELGIGPGDEVLIRIERDSSERTVTIPAELAQAFEGLPGSRAAFEKLSYSDQREHVDHIEEAKKSDTRQRRALRIAQTLGGRSERGDDG
jgi:bifunctional DNA-binding transcriptional regulator/antitoxin component of YhaV-PrlF toxin-antitoxin module